jgi:antimicrobial peptide system SdpA family protein
MGTIRRAGATLLGVVTVALSLGWTLLFVYGATLALPFNPVRLPGVDQLQTRVWFPQGWGFFTRDPREEDIAVHVRDAAGAWRPAGIGPNSRPRYVLGLDRAPRAQGVELGLLMAELPTKAWQPCPHADAGPCLEALPVAATVTNPTPGPSLCGTVGVVLRPPVPWAWARSRQWMPARVARLEVRC